MHQPQHHAHQAADGEDLANPAQKASFEQVHSPCGNVFANAACDLGELDAHPGDLLDEASLEALRAGTDHSFSPFLVSVVEEFQQPDVASDPSRPRNASGTASISMSQFLLDL
jgi:hypothetical protein